MTVYSAPQRPLRRDNFCAEWREGQERADKSFDSRSRNALAYAECLAGRNSSPKYRDEVNPRDDRFIDRPATEGPAGWSHLVANRSSQTMTRMMLILKVG